MRSNADKLGVLAIAVALVLLSGGALALQLPVQAQAPMRVTIGGGPIPSLPYLPLSAAQALGYFEGQNLQVEIATFRGGSDTALALFGGQIQFSNMAIDHAFKSVDEGGPTAVMLATFLESMGLALVVHKDLADEVQSPADLKGKRIGVTRPGSGHANSLTLQIGRALDLVREVLVDDEGQAHRLQEGGEHHGRGASLVHGLEGVINCHVRELDLAAEEGQRRVGTAAEGSNLDLEVLSLKVSQGLGSGEGEVRQGGNGAASDGHPHRRLGLDGELESKGSPAQENQRHRNRQHTELVRVTPHGETPPLSFGEAFRRSSRP